MPTVATSNLDSLHFLDARGAASRPFFLDAEELCCNSVSFLGLRRLATGSPLSAAAAKQDGNTLVGDGGESDCLLLGSHSDDEMSMGHSHANANGSNAALQFLLLDDDEAMCMHPSAIASEPARKVEAPAARLPCTATSHPLIQQHCAKQAMLEAPPAAFLDSSTMYCLAVVDEATGLPLRPATPEETWEVERCFVLQQQSELIETELPLEQQQQQQCCLGGRAGSSSVSEVNGDLSSDSADAVHDTEAGAGLQPQGQEQEQEQQQEEREEEVAEEEAAAPVARTNPNNNNTKRPDQPQRRCGPCDNCGATESPQWRQGPASKPLLCNACGMRFRRTNQLTAGETGTASGARGGARPNKKAPTPSASTAAAAAPVSASGPRQKAKVAAPVPAPLPPDAKRPRRAAAVAAAATVAAAIDAFS